MQPSDVEPPHSAAVDLSIDNADEMDSVKAEGYDHACPRGDRIADVMVKAEEAVDPVAQFWHRVSLEQQFVHIWKSLVFMCS